MELDSYIPISHRGLLQFSGNPELAPIARKVISRLRFQYYFQNKINIYPSEFSGYPIGSISSTASNIGKQYIDALIRRGEGVVEFDAISAALWARIVEIPRALGTGDFTNEFRRLTATGKPYVALCRIIGLHCPPEHAKQTAMRALATSPHLLDAVAPGLGEKTSDAMTRKYNVRSPSDVGRLILACVSSRTFSDARTISRASCGVIDLTNDSIMAKFSSEEEAREILGKVDRPYRISLYI